MGHDWSRGKAEGGIMLRNLTPFLDGAEWWTCSRCGSNVLRASQPLEDHPAPVDKKDRWTVRGRTVASCDEIIAIHVMGQ